VVRIEHEDDDELNAGPGAICIERSRLEDVAERGVVLPMKMHL
jgi:hypothetical protein